VPARGLAKVKTLVRWQTMAHNMTRVMSTPALFAALPARLGLA
jgi:hypothetical protein